MKVIKFGGTSVGSAQRMKDVAKLIIERGKNIVVLSAMSGTTNTLVDISNYLYQRNLEGAKEVVYNLQLKYDGVIDELLLDSDEHRRIALAAAHERFDYIRSMIKESFTVNEEREILSQGELLSTMMMCYYLQSIGVNVVMLPALDFMRTDNNGEPDGAFIHDHLLRLLKENAVADLYITQGYICRNANGDVDNLQRGGSDYTASLIGAAMKAEEIEIWTDIDGMHNNDPRFVENTQPVSELHFEEAAELAYFGAKILHPTCIQPAKENNIPVYLLNTLEPSASGTKIYNNLGKHGIKAIAAKDNITAIKIKSSRMLLAYGFLRKVFEIFEVHKTPIDMITTSEVGGSVTIDTEKNLDRIVEDLKKFGTVTVDHDMVIVAAVGNLDWHNRAFEAEALDALKDIPVRMISYGGSNFNISFLVEKEYKVRALNLLSDHLFNNRKA